MWSFRLVWLCLCAFILAGLVGVHCEKSSKTSSAAKLNSKVSQLLEWNLRRSIVTLSSDKFNTYVRSKPRNYSVVAMLTALKPQRQCSVCQEAFNEYQILANSWRYASDYSSSLFFVMVDIDEDGMDAFQQLQLNTAPTYFHFPAIGKRKPEDRYDIGRFGYSAEALAKWVTDRSGIHVTVMRPPNYTILMIWIPLLVLATIVGYLKRENLHKLYDTRYWAGVAIVWILIMMSGQMWNHIRGPPLYHRDPRTGGIGYFSGTSQYQFVAETYIILVLYGLISVGLIFMNEKFAFLEEFGAQKVAPVIGLGMVVLVFGYLLSIFRMKYQGYPYSFIFR